MRHAVRPESGQARDRTQRKSAFGGVIQNQRLFSDNEIRRSSELDEQATERLLEILAASGTAFSEVLRSYRVVIFVLLGPWGF